ncbi:hypothetical protein QAD02_013693 [Eretmocerus hayati]|uniref:Uncharacterized protein n=1 Tax=Eretmocerus hayati TaxID=131215 RepID=A0ACC2P4Y9_9HYME|nr:hypothetical protein QAD02_013693 [Eretmocerus hayati]
MLSELREFEVSEMLYNGVFYEITLYALLCDAPAKAFILAITYPSGYSSCPKCTVHGVWSGHTCLPGVLGRPRTDDGFRQRDYSNIKKDYHQRGATNLVHLESFGPVTKVPLEPIHAVYIGGMKKLIRAWYESKKIFPSDQLKRVSKRMIIMSKYTTYDFARRPRSLQYYTIFKATELRLFVLYVGPVALKEIVTDEVMRRCSEVETMNLCRKQNNQIEWSHQQGRGRKSGDFSTDSVVTDWRFDDVIINCEDGKNGCVLIRSRGSPENIFLECQCLKKDPDGQKFFVGRKRRIIGDLYNFTSAII